MIQNNTPVNFNDLSIVYAIEHGLIPHMNKSFGATFALSKSLNILMEGKDNGNHYRYLHNRPRGMLGGMFFIWKGHRQ